VLLDTAQVFSTDAVQSLAGLVAEAADTKEAPDRDAV
jgi:hypothetical protein